MSAIKLNRPDTLLGAKNKPQGNKKPRSNTHTHTHTHAHTHTHCCILYEDNRFIQQSAFLQQQQSGKPSEGEDDVWPQGLVWLQLLLVVLAGIQK